MKKPKIKPIWSYKDAKKLEKEYVRLLQATDFFKNFMGGAVLGKIKKEGDL